MWKKLQARWNVNSSWDVLVILLVFACTGFSVMYLKRFLFSMTGLDAAEGWLRWTVNILIILPLYQMILIGWGWVFGKYDFFLRFVNRMIAQLRKLVGIRG